MSEENVQNDQNNQWNELHEITTMGYKEKAKVWTTFWSLTVCSHQVSTLHNAPNNRAVSFIAWFKGLLTAWPLACLFWRLPETSAITQDCNQLGKTGAQQKAQPNLCQRNVKSQSGFTKTQVQEEVINVQWVNDQLHRHQGLTLQTINLDQIKQKGEPVTEEWRRVTAGWWQQLF